MNIITRGSLFVSTCLVLSLCANLHAETAPRLAWIKQIGTSNYDYCRSAAVDSKGNTYISGYTFGDLGGPNSGYSDAFLIKFDASGNELWSTQIGTAIYDYSYSVAVDALGNAYISGFIKDDLLRPDEAFLTKLDASGNELWTKQIDTAESDSSFSVAVDSVGNAYITGNTWGDLGGPNAGSQDAFLTKFDPSGNELWSTQIGTADFDESFSVAVDTMGNAYISGYTKGSLSGPNAGNDDAFLFKFDSAGNELWSTQIGTAEYDRSYSVATDTAGNAYISGYTAGDLGGPNAGASDAFLTKFDTAGNELWTAQIGTAHGDISYSVALDAAGIAYITGITTGDLGGPYAGNIDAFLTKFDTTGNELWTKQIGTMENDTSYSVAVDAADDVYISGITRGNLSGPNAGGYDAFLVKYNIPEPATLALFALATPALLRRR